MKDKILITGAAGFIGSHLTEMMTKKGFRVVALTDIILTMIMAGLTIALTKR